MEPSHLYKHFLQATTLLKINEKSICFSLEQNSLIFYKDANMPLKEISLQKNKHIQLLYNKCCNISTETDVCIFLTVCYIYFLINDSICS